MPESKPGDARRRRARRIRVVTVTCAVTGFCAVWSVVYSHMANGTDPALGKSKATTISTPSPAATSAFESDSADSDDTSADPTGAVTQSADSAPAPAPATSAQPAPSVQPAPATSAQS